MSEFIGKNFLLKSSLAQELFDRASGLPIFDYHCHLSPKEIFEDKPFSNLTELWLKGDHYKWRLMRLFGIDEQYITGNASDIDKFLAFAKCLPTFIGNPIYVWCHMELKQYFNITTPLSQDTAKEIWEATCNAMQSGEFTPCKLIEKSNVTGVVTTDDPVDNLQYHSIIAKQNLPFVVLPTFRIDNVYNIEKFAFTDYILSLEGINKDKIDSIEKLLIAIEKRLIYFIDNGCKIADIGMENFPKKIGDLQMASNIFVKVMNSEKLSIDEMHCYKFWLLKSIIGMFCKYNIAMQIHIGVIRNQNSKIYKSMGIDRGCDSIGNEFDISACGKLFDELQKNDSLPKTILYTLNPTYYYPLSTMLANFAGGERGKMQLGSAWWFLDHNDGIREQLKILSATGGLGLFVGMLTDSRAYTSYVRHEYFRRILCDTLADIVLSGQYPYDKKLLNEIVENICYKNIKSYIG